MYGSTALYCASFSGHTEIVQLLLNHPDIKVNITNRDGRTPLKIASEEGHTQIMELLKAKEEEEKKRFEALPLVKKISEVKKKYEGKLEYGNTTRKNSTNISTLLRLG